MQVNRVDAQVCGEARRAGGCDAPAYREAAPVVMRLPTLCRAGRCAQLSRALAFARGAEELERGKRLAQLLRWYVLRQIEELVGQDLPQRLELILHLLLRETFEREVPRRLSRNAAPVLAQ